MTREEERQQAAIDYCNNLIREATFGQFVAHIAGSKWADEHPVSYDGKAMLYVNNKSHENGYKEGLYSGLHGATKEDAEHYFPELKESKDERIRKAIKKALQVRCDGSRIISDEPVTLEEAIAWLEKQGENKKLDADKVIAWIVANICDFEYYVKWFKKDFGL